MVIPIGHHKESGNIYKKTIELPIIQHNGIRHPPLPLTFGLL